MYEANPIAYVHENGITIIEPSEDLAEGIEYAYMHEGGISIMDGRRESRLLSGLALLALSP